MSTNRDSMDLALQYAGDNALYFEWLMSLVGGMEWFEGHEQMLARLLEIKFYWLHPLDENIALHGLELRAEYVSGQWKRELSVLHGECSVLEVLITLALQVETDLMTPVSGEPERRAHVYFEQLLSQVGLLDCEEDAVDEAVDRFLEQGLTDYTGSRPTLWSQVNMLFMDEAMMLDEEV